MRYRLRTLLIVLALGPPVLAGAWIAPQKVVERYRQWQFDQLVDLITRSIAPGTGDLTDNTLATDEAKIEPE
ncbi:MAG TPA: hypothetical protein VGI40_21185 [Pirellulaceae bacterium]|jgi:hypothetical protein